MSPASKPDVKPEAASETGSRARGRPRNEAGRAAILRAARELIDEAGPAGLTMEAVAARAGVGKPTVYRWFENRHAVAMAALIDAPPVGELPRRRRRDASAIAALELQLLTLADTLASRHGRHVTTMIAAADPDTEMAKAFRHHVVLARRSEGRALLQTAVTHGELRDDIDVDIALDEIYGALFFRLLLGHAPVDAPFVRRLVAQAVAGLHAQR